MFCRFQNGTARIPLFRLNGYRPVVALLGAAEGSGTGCGIGHQAIGGSRSGGPDEHLVQRQSQPIELLI